jgi:hypothetical protein
MPDHLTIENGRAIVTTEEGKRLEFGEAELLAMLRGEFLPPLNGAAFPDGVKFMEWRDPTLVVVHQMPPHCRRLRWIAPDSPADYGPGTKYRTVRLSIPYAITFAVYHRHAAGLHLTNGNELYFRNQPLVSRKDTLGYPALLNISRIKTKTRERSWICTQHLRRSPQMDWTRQLEALLEHTWNGAFNRSSERHEGASWYGASAGIHPDLHPVEKWQQASERDETFALSVGWKPAQHTVAELVELLLGEQASSANKPFLQTSRSARPASLANRFLQFALKQASQKKKAAATP